MKYESFIKRVQEMGECRSPREAIKVTRSTLKTLSERLSQGEARHVAAQLPKELGIYLAQEGDAERFSINEFFGRIARRQGVGVGEVVKGVRGVTDTVRHALNPQEVDDMFSQLPDEFRQLFDAGPRGDSRSEVGHT